MKNENNGITENMAGDVYEAFKDVIERMVDEAVERRLAERDASSGASQRRTIEVEALNTPVMPEPFEIDRSKLQSVGRALAKLADTAAKYDVNQLVNVRKTIRGTMTYEFTPMGAAIYEKLTEIVADIAAATGQSLYTVVHHHRYDEFYDMIGEENRGKATATLNGEPVTTARVGVMVAGLTVPYIEWLMAYVQRKLRGGGVQ